nr:MAG TPA: hypothetical protein [Caudoviricetes sp.]
MLATFAPCGVIHSTLQRGLLSPPSGGGSHNGEQSALRSILEILTHSDERTSSQGLSHPNRRGMPRCERASYREGRPPNRRSMPASPLAH